MANFLIGPKRYKIYFLKKKKRVAEHGFSPRFWWKLNSALFFGRNRFSVPVSVLPDKNGNKKPISAGLQGLRTYNNYSHVELNLVQSNPILSFIPPQTFPITLAEKYFVNSENYEKFLKLEGTLFINDSTFLHVYYSHIGFPLVFALNMRVTFPS